MIYAHIFVKYIISLCVLLSAAPQYMHGGVTSAVLSAALIPLLSVLPSASVSNEDFFQMFPSLLVLVVGCGGVHSHMGTFTVILPVYVFKVCFLLKDGSLAEMNNRFNLNKHVFVISIIIICFICEVCFSAGCKFLLVSVFNSTGMFCEYLPTEMCLTVIEGSLYHILQSLYDFCLSANCHSTSSHKFHHVTHLMQLLKRMWPFFDSSRSFIFIPPTACF